ncbi:6-phosphogluconate dehydrogenase-like protein [Bimuria novae-zelandiae CBS 107.79]|uniref:6-phosphogluconate dehydrogenase-like protein n=1 Tax=Bimuria novae-zelandiae CBS 107.79 TaxID=1447943 RepID=A0A6A5V256_9PLEO|nr:6-phosphogluconate dehydrogenase-like protein [Bimuria novae-zelandiae CBS 107.79]
MAPKFAFLGMGSMGRAMSKNLAEKGNLDKPVTLWNRTHTVASDWAATIGPRTNAVEDLVEAIEDANMVWSCLATQDAVLSCFNRILETNVRGKLFIESSTVTPEALNKLAERVREAGAEFISMPVFGEPNVAMAGKLVTVPAGPKESVTKILPYLEGVVARGVVNLSEEHVGTASHLKLIGNVMILLMIEAVAEIHVLAEKTGLKNEVMHDAINTLWPGAASVYSKQMLSGQYYMENPMVPIDMAVKVSTHVLSLAEAHRAELPAYKAVRRQIDAVKECCGPAGDLLGVYGVGRLQSGLPYKKEKVLNSDGTRTI